MSRLLVGVLFVGVPCSILYVGRAGAQAVQVTAVLGVIDVVLKEHLQEEKTTLLWDNRQVVQEKFHSEISLKGALMHQ